MTRLRIALSLTLVGPRAHMLAQADWPIALRIAIGAEGPASTPDERRALVDASLPWRVFDAAALGLRVYGAAGNVDIDAVRPGVEGNNSIVDKIAVDVADAARQLAHDDRLSYGFDGTAGDVSDDDTRDAQVSWPGLMQSVAGLPPLLAGNLGAVWYSGVPRTFFAEYIDAAWRERAGADVVVVPRAIAGHALHDYAAGVAHYGGAGDDASVVAYIEPLRCGALADADPPELGDYWLSVRDAREDSLLELAAQIDKALQPSSILAEITSDELTTALTVAQAGGSPSRPATAAEGLLVQTALTQQSRDLVAQPPPANERYVAQLAQWRSALLADALAAALPLDQALAQRLPAALEQSLRTYWALPTPDMRLDLPALARLAASRLPLAALTPALRPCRPGEGITLLLGEDNQRLLHERRGSRDAIDEIAAVQVFARRASRAADLAAAPWHALTGVRLGLGETRSAPQLAGVSAAYVDGVLCREIEYLGANLVGRNALQHAHRQTVEPADDAASSFLLAPLDRHCITVADALPRALALPLRYGDHYEFAAAVVDRAGGMAAALAAADSPWLLDWNRLDALQPLRSDTVQFRRRVPVGDCNLRPSLIDGRSEWPAVPDDVWLRCRENAGDLAAGETPLPGARPSVVLLVPDTDEFRFARPRYRFHVGPPLLDEHTLLRWGLPETHAVADERAAAVERLKQQLTAILGQRDALMAAERQTASEAQVSLPPDPAVARVGLRLRRDDGRVEQHVLAVEGELALQYANGDTLFDATTRELRLDAARYAQLDFVALVESSVFEGRFDRDALETQSGLLDPGDWVDAAGTRYVGFGASTVLVEVASRDLPPLDAARITLRADRARDVELHAVLDVLPHIENIHQFSVASERWVWRNAPLLDADWKPGTDPRENRRRLASGPPRTLFDAARRNTDQEVTHRFDSLAQIDRGFVARAQVTRRLPRPAPNGSGPPLYVDGRDATTHADYLRYRLTLRSRYAGVLRDAAVTSSDVRRIVTAFRGDPRQIKPPKLLALLPLTRHLRPDPRGGKGDAGSTPFLVVLDECWFREYGIGERLEVEVALVKAEIGDPEDDERPLLFGPLPDHHVAAPPLGDKTRERLLAPLDCFGPFGLSLDRSGNEALANASAFVVYAPPGTPPHYNLSVRLRRVLEVDEDGKIQSVESPYSDAHALYTLPSNDALIASAAEDAVLTLERESDGYFCYEPESLVLQPMEGDIHDEVRRQYRYVLLVGRSALDAGRDVDVFLPSAALWLGGGEAHWIGGQGADLDSGEWKGQVLEILVNGRHAFDPQRPRDIGNPRRSVLDSVGSLQQLFRCLLDDAGDAETRVRDAAGMIRRVSRQVLLQVRRDV